MAFPVLCTTYIDDIIKNAREENQWELHIHKIFNIDSIVPFVDDQMQ
jgi:hypothetical protein